MTPTVASPPEDAVALVTGGSGGIGGAVCRALSDRGHTVLVGYRSDEASAAIVAAACRGKAEPVQVDVAEPDAITSAVARAGDLGTLAVVVNNAGIADDDLLLRLDPDRIDRTLTINLRGAMLVAQASLRPMMRARYGRIVNVSSVVALRGNAGQSLYAGAKAGLIGFTKSLAREVARKGITVNAVAPGFVDTAMTRDLSDTAREHLAGLAPIGRAVDVDEVAAAVAYLASPLAGAVTGTVLSVDGGAGI
jgi:3-oxoacyl-[acyl-carrier protein] reductase